MIKIQDIYEVDGVKYRGYFIEITPIQVGDNGLFAPHMTLNIFNPEKIDYDRALKMSVKPRSRLDEEIKKIILAGEDFLAKEIDK